MKKSRLITFVLLVSFALLGAGYASYNQRLTTSSILSTAKFNIAFVGTPQVSQPSNMIVTANNPDPHTLNYSFNGIYPNSSASVSQKIQNIGTLPVMLNSAVLSNLSDSNGLDSAGILIHTIDLLYQDAMNGVSDERVVQLISGSNGLSNMLLNWEDNKPLVLAPNDVLTIKYIVKWPSGNATDNLYKDATVSYNLKIGYAQP